MLEPIGAIGGAFLIVAAAGTALAKPSQNGPPTIGQGRQAIAPSVVAAFAAKSQWRSGVDRGSLCAFGAGSGSRRRHLCRGARRLAQSAERRWRGAGGSATGVQPGRRSAGGGGNWQGGGFRGSSDHREL